MIMICDCVDEIQLVSGGACNFGRCSDDINGLLTIMTIDEINGKGPQHQWVGIKGKGKSMNDE
jgi:hypothetical protein